MRLDQAGSSGLGCKPLVFVLWASWETLVATLFPRGSRPPPGRDPEGHFGFALEISVDLECLGEAFWHHFPLFFGGLIFSGILMDFGEGPAAGGAGPLSLVEV